MAGPTVAAVTRVMADRYGEALARLLPTCRIWVNGSPATETTVVGPDDEVAVLPPVSGG